jgi:hypothetical protein
LVTSKQKIIVCVDDSSPEFKANYNMKVCNRSFEDVTKFRYLETTLRKTVSFMRKSNALWSDNACDHLAQNLLTSPLLPKKVKIKISETDFACIFVWVCDTKGRT